MKLSEAIRLGSLLVLEPEMGFVGSCAIGMANLASNGFKVTKNDHQPQHQEAYNHFDQSFPWVQNYHTIPCPKCKHHIGGREIVWHLFDSHVMYDSASMHMTIEQLADFIATIEPQEEVHLTEVADVPLRDLQAV